MNKSALWTIIIDAVVSVVIIAVGIWIAPEYREFALAIVSALQGIAAALVAYFLGDAKLEELRTELRKRR